jgi:hypothetical protein
VAPLTTISRPASHTLQAPIPKHFLEHARLGGRETGVRLRRFAGLSGIWIEACRPEHEWHHQKHPVRPEVNKEVVNDRPKLAIH